MHLSDRINERLSDGVTLEPMAMTSGDSEAIAAPTDRPGISPIPVLVGLLISFVFTMGAALWIYKKWIQYEPRVFGALPRESEQFAYLDIEQALVYEPFRRHLLPLIEVGRNSRESRLLAIERKTGIELGVDARELLWYRTGQGGGVLLGGLLRQDRLVPGMLGLMQEEGLAARSLGNEGSAMDGLAIGSARLSAPSRGVIGIERGTLNSPRGPEIAPHRLLPSFLSTVATGQIVLLARRREPLEGDPKRSLESWISVSVEDEFRLLVSSEAIDRGEGMRFSSELSEVVAAHLKQTAREGAGCAVIQGQGDLRAGPWVRSCSLSRGSLDRIVAALATDVRELFSLPE